MSLNAISINEAFAQKSSWSQISSIAAFHERMIELLLGNELNPKRLEKMPSYKASGVKKQANAAIQKHRASAKYFREMAGQMKIIETVTANG